MNQINKYNFKEKVNNILTKYSNRFDLSSSYNFFISCYSFICISEMLKNSDNISLVDEIKNIDENEDINEFLNKKIKNLKKYDELKNIFPSFGKKKSIISNENPLFELIEGFRSILHEIDLSQYGEAFSLILDQVFKTISNKGGSYYTPPSIADLLVCILNPEKNKTIYDPTCASGNLLVKAAKFVNETENASSELELNGQDINSQLLQISRQYVFISGSSNTAIKLGDCLLPSNEDHFPKYDYVISNPPFSMKGWSENFHIEFDPRFVYGLPPKNYADYAFIQHCIHSLKEKGRAVIIVSPGVLARQVDGNIRKAIVLDNIIDAVIKLPSKLFYGTDIAVNILVINKNKSTEDILFVDASDLFLDSGRKNILSNKDIEKISGIVRERKTTENISSTVTITEVMNNEGNLSVDNYIKKEVSFEISESLEELFNIQNEHIKELNNLNSNLIEITKRRSNPA